MSTEFVLLLNPRHAHNTTNTDNNPPRQTVDIYRLKKPRLVGGFSQTIETIPQENLPACKQCAILFQLFFSFLSFCTSPRSQSLGPYNTYEGCRRSALVKFCQICVTHPFLTLRPSSSGHHGAVSLVKPPHLSHSPSYHDINSVYIQHIHKSTCVVYPSACRLASTGCHDSQSKSKPRCREQNTVFVQLK